MNLYREAIEKLCKWRSVFAGWQLGTRSDQDPEAQAVRDLQEARLLLRVEQTATTRLLIEKGIFTSDEFSRAVAEEAEHLNKALEQRFPGFEATESGIRVDLTKASQTMRNWRP